MATKKKSTTTKRKKTKTQNGFILNNDNIDIHATNYPSVVAEDLINSDMGVYGYNVNLARAIPNVTDGCKPVERTVLYTGWKYGINHTKPFKKALRYIGLGSTYYVHGDASFYGSLVSLSRYFYTMYPEIEPHGNVGSISGDGAAAQRYVEMRLSKYTDKMLSDFREETTNWMPNYDNTDKQPVYLPVLYPNILLQGTYGIGQGFLSSIPSHNFKDIVDRVKMIIEDPDISEDKLVKDLVPDYPTGGIILNKKDLPIIYKTGNQPEKLKKYGIKKPLPIVLRGEIEVTTSGNLLIKSIPYLKTTGLILNAIQKCVKNGKITGISEIKDHTNRNNGVSIELVVKRGYDPMVIENQLYKYTPLQASMATQFICTTPDTLHFRYYTFKEMLEEWLNFRRNCIRRLINSDISKTKRKIHIDEGLLIVLNPKNTDKIIKMMRSSKNRAEIKENLIKDYGMTTIQSEYISGLSLYQLSKDEISKIKGDLDDQNHKLEDLVEYFSNKDKVNKRIISELDEGVKLFNRPRLTKAISIDLNHPEEAIIENTPHTLLLTSEGFIKKVDAGKIRLQHAKGEGINIGKIKENDHMIDMVNANNLDSLLLFSNQGKAYKLKTYEIKDSNLNSYGILVDSLIKLKDKEKIIYMMKDTTEDVSSNEAFLLFATKNGLIKKTSLSLYNNVPKLGFIAIDLNKDDELVGVKMIEQEVDIIVATEGGNIIRYNTDTIPTTKRTTKGVKSINLEENDHVAAFDVFTNTSESLFVVTSKANGKRIDMKSLPCTDRNKKVKPLFKLVRGEKVINAFFVGEDDEITIIGTKKVIKIPADQVPVTLRSASGKKIVKLGAGEKIVVASK